MAKKYQTVIHWFRRDLRLTDNTSLNSALADSEEVLPCYLLSNWSGSHPWTGAKRQKFLCECLASLDGNIHHLGGALVIRQGDPIEELLKLVTDSGAEAIFANGDVDSYGKGVEKEIREKSPVPVHLFPDTALHGPSEVLTNDETPYRVYTPFSKKWLPLEKKKPGPRPKSIKSPSGLTSLPLPDLATWDLKEDPDWDLFEGGEKAARARMKEALEERIDEYDDNRDSPSVQGTSRLSQDLRWGTISVRELYHKASSCNSPQFLKELAWREFYFQIVHHFPEVLEDDFNEKWRGLPWDEPGDQFEAWKKGETGFPIVDAGIRQLLKTGFMHNRLRMIVAMFLTKDLHIDWRLGEQFFAQHLLDGEIASNNGGWQWSAGTGADAAPYFRIQNPWTQSERHDKKGEYIKKWIPELADIDPKKFHAPPEDGKPLTKGYPAPIVDHGREREKTLATFKKHK